LNEIGRACNTYW